MTTPKEIIKLVERFEQNREQYTSGNYKEEQLRLEFLNPFFSALGWDIENRQGYAEPYKEVIHEDAIKIGSATKAPDYAFRIGGTRKFFVEAKNPSVNLKEDFSPSYQLRRYAWSAKLPLSILTDFQEFAIYDCRSKPLKTDKASTGRVRYLTHNDYLTEWDSIATVFSKEAVLKGSFDKFAESAKGKKGTTEVDDAFLKEIESWRELLAKNIALRNPKLSQPELNFSVQRTIDRIIFLRICEDRGIEPYAKLLTLVNGERVYRRLYEQFYRADEKYNSGLFHFEHEKDRAERPDELTPNLHIDDKPLKEIIGNLYYPDCPYEFSVLPADILGQVYEQFLGKVIRLTAGHQARVEEKPEVKKAGGVYYTPTYIVDYIVKNTVGKLLDSEPSPKKANVILSPVGKGSSSNDGTPASSNAFSEAGRKDLNQTRTDREKATKPTKSFTPKEASNLRILDPACGSGSFLIGAYQYLLNWHRDWFEKDGAEKHATGKNAALFRGPGGEWRLTTGERKRILLNNIYGVDIDSQAVEVTKLSLLLKVLEGENEQTISQQLKMFHERALPDLSNNIKCGNSLIGPDFYDGKQLSLLDDEEKNRINVFDWKKEFKEAMDAGGFDAVIGNPPYIRMEAFKALKDYLKANYSSHDERSDLYAYFIEREHKLLNKRGRFGMIVSNKFLRANYGRPLREFLSQKASIERVVDFAGLPVFAGATVRTIVLLTSLKESSKPFILYSPPLESDRFDLLVRGTISVDQAVEGATYRVSPNVLRDDGWSFAREDTNALVGRLRSTCITLEKYCAGQIGYGIKSGLEEAFVIQEETVRKLTNRSRKAQEIIKPYLNGRDIRRYSLDYKSDYLIYTYHGVQIKKYQAIEEYLEPFKDRLLKRATKQEWFELQQPQFNYKSYFDKAKIVFPDIAIAPRFALDEVGYYGSTTTFFIPKRDLYLLGILNSRLSSFYFTETCAALEGKKDKYLRFKRQYVAGFPVQPIDHADPTDKSRHDKMVQLVEQMLSLHKQLPAAKTEHEKTVIERQIEATDKQIDTLVYELYGLTEEEIKIVEGKA